MKNVQLYLGDCLELLPKIESESINLILCDLPYGSTKCRWDVVLPFEPLWEQYKRIIKTGGVILLFGTEPFASHLRTSNLKWYRYDWIWEKSRPSNPTQAKNQPMRYTENICVFYKERSKPKPLYKPIMWKGEKNKSNKGSSHSRTLNIKRYGDGNTSDMHYPKNIIKISSLDPRKIIHPTQKPQPLLEYLIETHTNEEHLILDNCMGSGSTGVACIKLNRKFIGMEKEENYFKIAKDRITQADCPDSHILK